MTKKKRQEAAAAANNALNGMVVHVAALSDSIPEPIKGQMAEAILKIAAAVNDITGRLTSAHVTIAENATRIEQMSLKMAQSDKAQRDEISRLRAALSPPSTSPAPWTPDLGPNGRAKPLKQGPLGNANLAPLGVRGSSMQPPRGPASMSASMPAPTIASRDMPRSALPAPTGSMLAPRHPAEGLRDASMQASYRIIEPAAALPRALSTTSTSSVVAPRRDSAVSIVSTHGTKRGSCDGEQHGPPKAPRLEADYVRAQQSAVPYINRVIGVERAKLAGAGLDTDSPQWREYVKYLQQHTGLGLAQLEPSNNVSLPGSASIHRSTPEPRLRAHSSPSARSEDPRLINRASAMPLKIETEMETPTTRTEVPRLFQKSSVLPSKAGTVTEMETEVARSQGSPKVKVKVELEEGEILESEI
ncbi:hypothetical protein LTR56_000662 [Elasticomyces elasticus]|nr:hypothetical protein LTR56_000662 [Elasticomyces elasticus]KAK3664439.1 hypothetical protein LTR22_004852 [Elasticomyces elasticus]KAK4919442.1 hypothetical protein LTR49_012976 [Elasticomyces elasticus]KAK5758315.1 hypothetical protein LTS12_011638 [Elasticomyces elasticus]